MSSPEDSFPSKRRKLNCNGVVKAERVGERPSTATATGSSSTLQMSPKGKGRDRSVSNATNGVEEADEFEGSVPPAAKRAKKEEPAEVDMDDVKPEQAANGGGEDDDDDGTIDDGDGTMADLSPEAKERLAMRDADGYLPGAIVRVQLKNFLTYDFAEFYPGPYLNMIIGPNGSGKSTVVNAIAIGLGWTPKILGRGDDLSQFLKYGATSAYVELELKNVVGQRNLIVKRSLHKDSNKSKMEMNGKHATMKQVREAVEGLNIQVGNLCSFLPQDKVSEFACMSPQELLAQTQKAAGPPQMTQWHQKLITAGGKFRELDENLQQRQDDLSSKQRAADRLEGEVRNAKEREKLVEEINFLDHIIPFAAYTKAREGYNQLRALRKVAHGDWRAAQAQTEPFEALLGDFNDAGLDAQGKLKKAQSALSKLESNMKTNQKNILQHTDSIEGCLGGIANLKNKAEQRRIKLHEAKEAVRKVQERCDARSEPAPIGDLEQTAADARLAGRQIDDEISTEVHQRRQPMDGQMRDKDQRIKQLKTNMNMLSEISHVRMRNLQTWPKSEDIYKAVEFLRADADRAANGQPSFFKMKVFEPPCLSVDIPDRRYANAIESSMNATNLRTIICQCREDYERLAAFSDNDRNPLGVKLAKLHLSVVEPGAQRERRPISDDALRQLGFDGFAIDFVRAADPVMTFLEVHAGLHRTAISLNQMGRGGLDWERVNASSLTHYVAGDTSFQTATSRYGAKTKSSGTQPVKPAKSFATSVDQAQIDRTQNEIRDLIKDIDELRASVRELEAREGELQRQKQEHFDAFNDAQQQIKAIKEHQKRNASLEQNFKEARSKYDRLKNAPSDEERRDQLIRELKMEVQAKIKQDLKYAHSCLQLSKVHQSIADINLEVMQVQANVQALQDLAQTASRAERDAEEYFKEVDANFKRQKEKTAKALNKAQTQLDELDEEAREAFQARRSAENLEEEGLDALEESRAEKQAELETIGGADPTVIAKYDKVQNEIRRLADEVADLEHSEKKLSKEIRETKDKWLPELQKLVKNFNQKFSEAMDSLDDRGEIRIREHEDYAQWAIEIMVSFRAEDKLHLLTSTHQSGGERSLSTIMYLMSMIELSNAPFSLVDERGMDPRAERAVHNQMVKVTCHKDAGQFFLLTPKLLQQLDYHERMRVLVVCNGEWLPEREKNDTKGKLYLRKILDDAKRKPGAVAV